MAGLRRHLQILIIIVFIIVILLSRDTLLYSSYFTLQHVIVWYIKVSYFVIGYYSFSDSNYFLTLHMLLYDM